MHTLTHTHTTHTHACKKRNMKKIKWYFLELLPLYHIMIQSSPVSSDCILPTEIGVSHETTI